MTSFGNFLTPLATAVGGYQKGQAQKQQDDTEAFMKMIQLKRQQQSDQMAEAMNQAQRGEIEQRMAGQREDVLLKQQKRDANARARTTYLIKHPDSPYSTYGPDDLQWVDELKNQDKEDADLTKTVTSERGAYNILKKRYPKSPWVDGVDFDPKEPGKYTKALQAEIDFEKQKSLFGHQDSSREDSQQFSKEQQDARIAARGPGGAGGTGGMNAAQAPNADIMEAAIADIRKGLAGTNGKPIKVDDMMQQRGALQFGVDANAGKGIHSFQDALTGAGMDLLGAGKTRPGYNSYQIISQASRHFADEALKMTKGRGGFNQLKNEISLAQIVPSDFENPMLLQAKLHRMDLLLMRAKTMSATPVTATTPTTAVVGGGGNDADAEAAAMIARHRTKTP